MCQEGISASLCPPAREPRPAHCVPGVILRDLISLSESSNNGGFVLPISIGLRLGVRKRDASAACCCLTHFLSLVSPAVSSARRIFVTPTASLASCSAFQRMSARSALIEL